MRDSSRNHTDLMNLKCSRSNHKKGEDAVTAGHTDKVTALSLHLTPCPWHSTVLNHVLQASTSTGWATASRVYCPDRLIRSADPVQGKEAVLELTALITWVIIHLHSQMVHYEMERSLPGPRAAGSSSGAGLRRQRSRSCVCTRSCTQTPSAHAVSWPGVCHICRSRVQVG